jgi:transcriptional regulator with XRE-family HTH domain
MFFFSIVPMGQLKNQALLKKIAQRVKELREKAGVTQEDFFNDTGIHLGRIETAKVNISVSTLDTICKYFKISLDQFFKGIL